jgi:hypothetical protein
MYSAEFYCLRVSFLSTGWLVQTKSPGRDGRHKQEERERKKGGNGPNEKPDWWFSSRQSHSTHTHTESLAFPP